MQHRKTNSKAKIEEAFINLLETENLNQITISKIAKQAKINRGTFYLHYLDMQDLLDNIMHHFFAGIQNILESDTLSRTNGYFFSNQTIEKICSYIKENFTVAKVIVGPELSSYPSYHLERILQHAFASKAANINSSKMPAPYASQIIFSGLISTFSLWIHRDMKETPNEIQEIVRNYSGYSPKEILA